jgi:DNA-directed RNA polymerase specialized sigma24 family protein
LCRRSGRFPQLDDQNNLWAILVVIAARKAIKLTEQEKCQKRGGGAVRGESVFLGPQDADAVRGGLDQFLNSEPTPEFLAQVTEEYSRRLEELPHAELRSLATWKMEGYTNQEIAAKLGCATATVERKLGVIRAISEREVRE